MRAVLAGGPKHGRIIEIPAWLPAHMNVEVRQDVNVVPTDGEQPPQMREMRRYVLSSATFPAKGLGRTSVS